MIDKNWVFNIIWLVAGLFPASVASQTLDQQVRPKLLQAEQFLETGSFVEALKSARTALQLLPQNPPLPDTLRAEVHYWMGRCYAALVENKLAAAQLDSAHYYAGNPASRLGCSIDIQSGVNKLDADPIRSAIQQLQTNYPQDNKGLGEAHMSLGICLLQAGNEPQNALAALQKALGYFSKTGQLYSAEGKSWELIGYHLWRNEIKFEPAYTAFKKAESIYVKLGGTKSHYLGTLYINLGACLDDMGQARQAVEHYETAYDLLKSQNPAHPVLFRLYNNLGNALSDLGDFTRAIKYLEEAILIAPPDQSGRYWNNLGDVYLDLHEDLKAEACFLKAIPLLTGRSFQLARPYHNLSILYRRSGKLDSALVFALKALPLRMSNPNAWLDIARSYHGVGECYLALDSFERALSYFDAALALQHRSIPSGLNAEIASSYVSKARCFAATARCGLAFSCLDSALFACAYAGMGRFSDVIAPPELLTALERKAALFYQQYEESQQESLLEAAELGFDTAAQAVRYFRNTLLESESRAVLAGQFRDILSGGVAAAMRMHQLHPEQPVHLRRAFAFSEQSKALVLLEGVRSAGAVQFAGISDTLLNQERRLQQAVSDAEVGLRKILERGKTAGDSMILKVKKEVFERQNEYEVFQRNLAAGKNPAYFNVRYGTALASPEEVQSQLSETGSMLVYFIGKAQEVTAFVINKKEIQAVSCGKLPELELQIEALRKGLFGYYTLPLDKRSDALLEKTLIQFTTNGQILYQQLIAPVEHLLREAVSIIPDGPLATVPFELLLTAPPADPFDFGSYDYWFKSKNHSISYAYSATLLREMTQKQHRIPPEHAFFALSPFFPGTKNDVITQKPLSTLSTLVLSAPGRRNFKPLPYSGEELLRISALWNGRYEVGKACSRALFLREAPHARMIHLSTHGVLDSSYSYLAFAPAEGETSAEPLYLRELYNLQLNADLVTLSACETGLGELQRGEGVISLARAFAYAGAKSIVNSLWQVDNAATKTLMVDFYKNLSAGQTKDRALREAKLHYLNDPAQGSEQTHPFFWAGLVGVGDMRALKN